MALPWSRKRRTRVGEEEDEYVPPIVFTIGIEPWVSKTIIHDRLGPMIAGYLQSIETHQGRAVLTFAPATHLAEALKLLYTQNGFYALSAEEPESWAIISMTLFDSTLYNRCKILYNISRYALLLTQGRLWQKK